MLLNTLQCHVSYLVDLNFWWCDSSLNLNSTLSTFLIFLYITLRQRVKNHPHLWLLIQQYFDIADYVGSPSITVVKEGLAGTYTNFKILQCPQYWIFLVFSWNCLDFEKKSKRYAQLPIGVNNPASVTKFASAVLESWFRAHNSRIIIADK